MMHMTEKVQLFDKAAQQKLMHLLGTDSQSGQLDSVEV